MPKKTLTIRIEQITDGLEAHLIEKSMYAETDLDQVTGSPEDVMKIVQDWLEATENLTTIKNI